MTTPKKLPPPPPPKANMPTAGQGDQVDASPDRFSIITGKVDGPQRVVLYGPGGIGKSTLASLVPNPVFLDIESSTRELDVPRARGVNNFADLRGCLQSNALDAYDTIILDSATKAEEWAISHTLENVPAEKGSKVNSVEGYGFGKGYTHVYDTFLLLLADLDSQVRRGRNVLMIAHDCVTNVPNPVSDDFIRFEPHLQSPKSGKASIRNRVVQWADHVLFIGYDVMIDGGKGKGGGTRTIYTAELPSHIAKSRRVATAMPFESAKDGKIWEYILGGQS